MTTPERWQRVSALYQSALEHPRDERGEFLRAACAGDEELQREVESLLDQEGETADFSGRAAIGNKAYSPAIRDSENINAIDPLIGRVVSYYRIRKKLGGGGMGVVYEAEDVRLHRLVALKCLPEDTARDVRALDRFQREAQAASALDHPNICTLYDIGECEGRAFMVMEHLDGATLKHRIEGRPMAIGTVLNLGAQIASGLHAAHMKGIVHRDIKPANVFVTEEGQVKILDFGLAQLASTDAEQTRGELTSPGVIMGTLGYMSPEQALGLPVDVRSDLFSFGLLLYEMATGKRALAGVHASVDVPGELGRIISKCLENDPELRYQAASEIAGELQSLANGDHTGQVISHAGSKMPMRAARRWEALVLGTGVAIGLAVAGYFYSRSAPKLTNKDKIVLANFTNATDQPVFDDTLQQGLAVELEQSPFLNMIPEQEIEQTLALMGKSPDTKLTLRVAQEVCQRTGSTAVLDGSIARIGTRYLLTLGAMSCVSGASLASAEATASDENHVLDALGRVSVVIRRKLGESLSTVQRFDTPLEQATTPSLDALKAFTSGMKVINTRGSHAAIPFFQQAINLDPEFALAYAYLGIMENDILETSKAVEYERMAYQLRERSSEVEKYSITAAYEMHVTGDVQKAIDACQLWIQAYPGAYQPHDLLAGAVLPVIGQYEGAVDEAGQAIRLNPDFPIAYFQRMSADIALNRIDDAKATYTQAAGRGLKNPFFDIALYKLAFLQNDPAAMARQVSKAKGLAGFEDQLLNMEGDTAAYSGSLRVARQFTRRAIDSAHAAGKIGTPVLYTVTAALREAWFGNKTEALDGVARALKDTPPRDVIYLAGLALAYSGDAARAQVLADDLARTYPEDTIVQFNFLPTLRAKIALDAGNSSRAIELLQAAEPYELGLSTESPFNWTAMYPVYVRGEADLAAGRGPEAAAEFQQMISHRGLVLNQPIGPLARLGLARAYMLEGETAKARAAYQDFFTLWKNADPDIPVLRQAKAEYSKLQ